MGLRGPNRLGVCIQVEDVDEVYRHVVDACLTVERPPEERPWGTREFFLLDPDGHAVTFFEEPPESPHPGIPTVIDPMLTGRESGGTREIAFA